MPIKVTNIRAKGNAPINITHYKTEHGTIFTRQEMYIRIKNGGSYTVNVEPYPKLVEATSPENIGYVHSKKGDTSEDKLMELPEF